MSHARDDTPEAVGEANALGERVSAGWRGLISRVGRATGSVSEAAAKGRGRAAEAAGGLRRSAPLRHGLAAWERDNLEAALALLREAADLTPEDAEAVLALWNVALSCERPRVAAPAMARWIHAEASAGRRDVATEHWMELVEQVPEQAVDASTLVRLLPELRSRVASASDAKTRAAAEKQLQRALRASVDPETPGLTPGLALRVLEQARYLDAPTARKAGAFVLAATDLHESKRRSVEKLLEQLDAPGKAEAQAAPVVTTAEVSPVELDAGGLIVLEAGAHARTRIDLRSIEAIAVARVGGFAAEAVLLVDLLLRRAPRARERRIFRMRPEAFDAGAVLAEASGHDDPLRLLLGALLDRSGAVPLPDPDSALGLEPRHFDSLEAYEAEILSRLPEREPDA